MIGRADDGVLHQRIEQATAELDHLSYLGELPIDEVNRRFSQADIFVNTSEVEGFPNTFIQAWLNFMPVVSLQFDPDNVLASNAVGFHAEVSFEEMLDHVRRLIEDNSLRTQMGHAAREYAQETHGLISNVQRLSSWIEGL